MDFITQKQVAYLDFLLGWFPLPSFFFGGAEQFVVASSLVVALFGGMTGVEEGRAFRIRIPPVCLTAWIRPVTETILLHFFAPNIW